MTTSSTQPPALEQLLSELADIEDPEMRAQLLIEYGEKFVDVPPEVAKRPFPEANRIPACESEAFLFTEPLPNGSLKFYFAVENPQGISAMALATIIDETLSGAPLAQVANLDDELVYTIFGKGLSMGKGMGLRSMINSVKVAAKKNR